MSGLDVPGLNATARVLGDVAQERTAQDAEWGGAQHDDQRGPYDWIAEIVKHLGRASTALVARPELASQTSAPWRQPGMLLPEFRRAMVVVAALGVAGVEWYDRLEARADESGVVTRKLEVGMTVAVPDGRLGTIEKTEYDDDAGDYLYQVRVQLDPNQPVGSAYVSFWGHELSEVRT